ncbi:MAG: DUF445 family protein [Spirochaetaceae bacterium]|jgi:uncharacterized membrane protein YheB (UPF0754 family)|nr:DUF445 family protein [Spirochaetaceae bacterium]
MKSLLVWLVPPLVGAVIGYVTNAVAIKMLFRPLKAVFVWGLRLPFTPGILPRQRHKLAESIGAMVERELFTPEILKARLHRSDVRENIRESIARYTEKLLNTPLERIIRSRSDPGPSVPPEDIPALITRLAVDFINSPAFDLLWENAFSSLADPWRNRTLRDILGGSGEEKLESVLREGIRRALPDIKNLVTQKAVESCPEVLNSFIQLLKKEEIHREMEIHGRIFLNNTILKLSVFQRLFISAGQYDRTLHERMPEIIDDLIRELENLAYDEDINRRMAAFIREKAGACFSDWESSGEFGQIMGKFIRAHVDIPLERLVRQWTAADFSEWGEKLRSHIKQKEGRDIKIRAALDRFLDNHRDLTAARFFSLGDEKKKDLDARIGDKLLVLMDEQIEALLTSINVKTLVSERIDSLDMIRVERIILDVMADQLHWINIFGAILGALIGLFQSLFSWFIL